MPRALYLSFFFYAFVAGITPGPANLCSLSAALRFGRHRALRQWTGIFTGFAVDSFVSALLCRIIGGVLGDYVKYLSYIGCAYLLYLAFKMLKSSISQAESGNEQCSFLTGLLVQLTNVKVILFCTTTFTIYVLPYSPTLPSLLKLAVVLPFTGPICNLAWLFLGDALRRFFLRWQREVNIAMAISLVLCALTLVI